MLVLNQFAQRQRESKMSGKILLVGAHPDDIEFGAGGTVARLIDEGMSAEAMIFSNCEESLPAGIQYNELLEECKKALHTLGLNSSQIHFFDIPVRNFPSHRQEVLQILIDNARSMEPDLVLYPNPNDIHQDHSAVAKEVERALKNSTLWAYELPWNNLKSEAQGFVELNESHVKRKLEAISCYASQSQRFYADPSRINAHMISRGAQIGVAYAEMFAIPRSIKYL